MRFKFIFVIVCFILLLMLIKVEIYHVSCMGAMIGTKRSTIITIANDEEFNKTLDNIMDLTQANLDGLKLYQSSWKEQIKVLGLVVFSDIRSEKPQEKIQVNGGNLETATFADYLMHYFTFGLKVILSSCPPAGMGGGWPAFFVSLVYIGLFATIVGWGMSSSLTSSPEQQF